MASETKDLFGCPYCGFRVSPSDDTCPRCGNSFSDSTRFECPFCGDMVSPGIEECPSCHVNFKDFLEKANRKVNQQSVDTLLLEIINLEATTIGKEDKKFSCPNCSWMLTGMEYRCPKCGTDLTADSALQCPICGAFVKYDAVTCPDCGASFEPDLGVKGNGQKVEEDHNAVTSALTDILESAGHKGPLPEIEEPAPEPEPVIQRPVDPVEEPKPVVQAPAVPEPESEPVPEPEPIPLQKAKTEPVVQGQAPAAAPKKPKQRKLKAKTQTKAQ